MKCHVAIKKVWGIYSSNGYNKFSLFIKKRSEIPEYIRDENRGGRVCLGGGRALGRGKRVCKDGPRDVVNDGIQKSQVLHCCIYLV